MTTLVYATETEMTNLVHIREIVKKVLWGEQPRTIIYGNNTALNLNSYISFLQQQLEKVPLEYQETAQIMCRILPDKPEIEVSVFYNHSRPETAEEKEKRESFETPYRVARQEKEIDDLKKLMQKYPEIVQTQLDSSVNYLDL